MSSVSPFPLSSPLLHRLIIFLLCKEPEFLPIGKGDGGNLVVSNEVDEPLKMIKAFCKFHLL